MLPGYGSSLKRGCGLTLLHPLVTFQQQGLGLGELLLPGEAPAQQALGGVWRQSSGIFSWRMPGPRAMPLGFGEVLCWRSVRARPAKVQCSSGLPACVSCEQLLVQPQGVFVPTRVR